MISVIIPVRNCQATLADTLSSVAAQTEPDFEALVVDNGSTDGSRGIAEGFAAADPRFRVLSCPRPGVSHARNAGMEAAAGAYLFFLDGDDLLLPEALSRMLAVATRDNADLVVPNLLRRSAGGERPIDPRGEDSLTVAPEIPELFRRKLSTYLLFFPFKLVRASLPREHGLRFDPAFSLGEDLLFTLDCFQAAERVSCIAEPLYVYQPAPGGLNTRYRADLAETKFALSARLRQYLAAHGKLDRQFDLLLLRDVFALAVNERLARNPKGVREMLRRPEADALRRAGRIPGLTAAERLALLCVRLRLGRLLYAAAGIWLRQNGHPASATRKRQEGGKPHAQGTKG